MFLKIEMNVWLSKFCIFNNCSLVNMVCVYLFVHVCVHACFCVDYGLDTVISVLQSLGIDDSYWCKRATDRKQWQALYV